jgi:hypothetical protein
MSQKTTIVTSAVVSALVASVVSVSLQKYLDLTFPTPVVIQERRNIGLDAPPLSLTFDYAGYAPPGRSRLFGLLRDLPTYYYDISLGNAANESTGIIGISIDFLDSFQAAAAFLSDRTVNYPAGTALRFQAEELAGGFGRKFQIALKAKELPDLTKASIRGTCALGNFERISKAQYSKMFTPIKGD